MAAEQALTQHYFYFSKLLHIYTTSRHQAMFNCLLALLWSPPTYYPGLTSPEQTSSCYQSFVIDHKVESEPKVAWHKIKTVMSPVGIITWDITVWLSDPVQVQYTLLF